MTDMDNRNENLQQLLAMIEVNCYLEPTCGNQGKDPKDLASSVAHSDA